MNPFIDNTEEVVLNELLRNYEQNRDGWLNSRDLSNKKKKELSLGLDLVYSELKQGTLTSRNEIREFVSSGNPELSWARQSALGYLAELLDARPRSKPKELDRYTNADMKKYFGNTGWASSNNEINLNNWEAKDYDTSTSTFTGRTERISQMAKFLEDYKKQLKSEYNFEGSRYSDLKDLTKRLDTAIEALKSAETNEELKMDTIRQALGAIGWSDSDVNNLFRMEIPVESEEEEESEAGEDPVAAYTAAVNEYKLLQGWAELNAAVAALNAPKTEDLFAEQWDTEMRQPYKHLPEFTEIKPKIDLSVEEPLSKDVFAQYTPWGTPVIGNNSKTDLTPEQLSELSVSLLQKLANIGAEEVLENADIENIKLIYEKIKGSKSEGLLKKVSDKSSEVYLDGFVFRDKGIYYSYDPNTKQLYRRRIMDNLNIYKDYYKQFDSEYKEKEKYQGFFKKLGGVLKCAAGDYILYDFTPKSTPSAPGNNPSNNPTQTEASDWESAGVTDFSNWTWRDWSTVGLIMLDLGAIPASYMGPYGPLIGGGMGLASTIGGAVNDFTDGNITWLDFKNLGVGLAADVVGLIPAWGDAATIGKVLNGITKSAAITQLISSVPAGAEILRKHREGEEITVLDMHFLSNLFSGIAGFSLAHSRNRKTKKLNEVNDLDVKAEAPRLHDVWFNDKLGFYTNWMRLLYQGSGPMSKGKKSDEHLYFNRSTGQWQKSDGTVVEVPTMRQPEPTTTETPTPPAQPAQPSTPSKPNKPKAKSINDVPKKDVKAMRNLGYSDKEILDIYNGKGTKSKINRDKNGAKLESLKALRTGGVLKWETGAQAVSAFDRNLWKYFKKSMIDNGYTWDRKSNQFLDSENNPLMVGETALNKDNYTTSEPFKLLSGQIQTVRESLPLDLQYKNSTSPLEFVRALGTIGFNDVQKEKAIKSINDNIVLPLYEQHYGAQLSNGIMDTLGYDKAISNIYDTMSNFSSTDPNAHRNLMVKGLGLVSDLLTQKNQILANNVKESQEAINAQEQANLANRVEVANERASILSSASKAMDDIEMASNLKNFNAVDSISLNIIKNQTLKDERYNEFALSNLTDAITEDMYKEIDALGPDATDAQIREITEKYRRQQKQQIGNFYGISSPTDPFEFKYLPNPVPGQKKGGKLDRNLEISKLMEKRYLAQLKNTDKQIDRLSKVTYKAILKSLGLK